MKRKLIMDFENFVNIKKELKNNECETYVALVAHVNSGTKTARVAITTLSGLVNKSASTVKRDLQKLKEAGYIKWETGSNLTGTSNIYYFLKESFCEASTPKVPAPPKLKASPAKKAQNKKATPDATTSNSIGQLDEFVYKILAYRKERDPVNNKGVDEEKAKRMTSELRYALTIGAQDLMDEKIKELNQLMLSETTRVYYDDAMKSYFEVKKEKTYQLDKSLNITLIDTEKLIS